MRVAINTLAMKGELYGVGNYIKNLVRSLALIDAENEYFLFASAQNIEHLVGLPPNFHLRRAPGNRGLRLLWEQTMLPLLLMRERIDVYHGPMFVAPFLKTCRHVVSILDMTFHVTPGRHSWHKRMYFRRMIPSMVRRSDCIITISESTKRDVMRLLNPAEERLRVVHLGADSRFGRISDEQELSKMRGKYGITRKFILFVGLIEPRKNVEALVDAYLETSVSAEFDLILAGNLGWSYSGLTEKIASSQARDRIRMPGYVADADLPALYSAASVFVYPSLYEGFGLPVLEAMSCGTPVITSSVSSLPEVTGDAGILVDPCDVGALASAMERVLGDKELQEDLSMRGRQRARLFTWEQTAHKTLEVYRDVYAGAVASAPAKVPSSHAAD